MPVLLAGAAYATYQNGLWRINKPSLDNYPIQGLDVSHHQGDIRWNEIPKDRFQFVYIKATEGGDFKDKKFVHNWKAASEAGLKVGAYHFFTLCRPGADQAQNFIESVPAEKSAMPPVIDLEFVGNCSKRPAKDEFLRELEGFIDVLEIQNFKKPVIYTTYHFYDEYLAETKYSNFPIWIRDIWKEPKAEAFNNMHMWQYADNARIQGIDGPVDLNVMYAN